ncbi:MAG TPA: hypothetical protein VGG39_23585 [Polyangiaceae bacterium]
MSTKALNAETFEEMTMRMVLSAKPANVDWFRELPPVSTAPESVPRVSVTGATNADDLANAVADRVVACLGERPAVHAVVDPLLLDYRAAARLLGTTVAALKSRVSRGDNRLCAVMVTSGRSVRFHRDKLVERFRPGK